MNRIVVLGGDLRNYHLFPILEAAHRDVRLIGFDKLEPEYGFSESLLRSSLVVVGPVPFSLDGVHLNAPYCGTTVPLETVLPLLSPGTTVITGAPGELRMPPGVSMIDLYAGEEFVLKTVLVTSEGILEILIRESDITLHDSRALIVGMGRIGLRTGRLLRQFGALVTAVADDPKERGTAFMEGFAVARYDDLADIVAGFDFILNTSPHPYFDELTAGRIDPSAVFLDIASPPGALLGVEPGDLRCRFLCVRGIPGKTAPKTVARYMANEIERILEGC